MRRKLASGICLLILMPILPLYFLRAVAQGLVDFLDWATEGRTWCKPFLVACGSIEKAFGVDPNTEYRQWQERMHECRIVTKKSDV